MGLYVENELSRDVAAAILLFTYVLMIRSAAVAVAQQHVIIGQKSRPDHILV